MRWQTKRRLFEMRRPTNVHFTAVFVASNVCVFAGLPNDPTTAAGWDRSEEHLADDGAYEAAWYVKPR